jgi:surface protein
MNESFEHNDLENLLIEDKEYQCKRKIRIIIIIVAILIFIGILIGVFFIVREIKRKKGGKIICSFMTSSDNEIIRLIRTNEDIEFGLIIDGTEYDKKYYHSFEKAGLHSVIFHFQNKLDSLERFFNENSNLIEVDFSQLETENIKSMAHLFNKCRNLTKANFGSNFDTSKVTNMRNLFYSCKELNELDLSTFKLENVINAESMFEFCYKLKEIIFNNNTRTNNLEIMTNMFRWCRSLEYINAEILNANKAKNLNYIFAYCYTLREIKISYFLSTNL